MGQVLRRATSTATSRVRNGTSPLESSSSQIKNVERPPPPPPPPQQPVPKVELKPKKTLISQLGAADDPNQDDFSASNSDNVLEDKDPGYDAMLSQMVGRIKAKPGGKLETGEAFIVEKYDRPMPKLRNTRPESNSIEDKVAPPGTLNVAQLREILRLHQGNTMDKNQIAENYQIDVIQVEKILQFVSLPPEEKKKNNNRTM